MRLGRLLLAFVGLLLWAGIGHAQDTLVTAPQVPIGGSDTRSLPGPTQLPPMFGADLFAAPFNARLLGVTPGLGGTAGAALGGGAAPIPTTAGLAALAAGAAGKATAGAAATAAAPTTQPPVVPSTSVQPPGGVAAFDPNHMIAPGDVLQVHIYGATTLDQQVTVDGNGEIFCRRSARCMWPGSPRASFKRRCRPRWRRSTRRTPRSM